MADPKGGIRGDGHSQEFKYLNCFFREGIHTLMLRLCHFFKKQIGNLSKKKINWFCVIKKMDTTNSKSECNRHRSAVGNLADKNKEHWPAELEAYR